MNEHGGEDARTSQPIYLRPEENRRVSLLNFASSLLRHRRAIVAVPLAVAVLVVGWTLLQPRSYTTTVSFTPSQVSESQLGQLQGLAAQFGVPIPTGGGNRSPQFYGDLLRSEEILRSVVRANYVLPEGPLSDDGSAQGSLTEVFALAEVDSLVAQAKAIERLRDMLVVRSDVETGIVSYSVRSKRPKLSRQLASRLLDAVNEFNVDRRSSQAAEERRFLANRIQTARQELETAEDSLRLFLERNRSFEGSPRLRFEHDRLERQVAMQQQIYTSLQQSLEQARIEEVRNTPVITVAQRPVVPALADRRHLFLKGILGLLLGGGLAVMWALGQDARRLMRWSEDEHVEEFRRLIADAREEIERAATRVRGIFGQ